MKATIVSAPAIFASSACYPANRQPLIRNPMLKLPLGSIRPQGWLKHQLALMVNGLTGRLPEVSEFLKDGNGWFKNDGAAWEEQPYWYRGFHDLAVLTGDARCRSESKRWMEAVLRSQEQDGYFGPCCNKHEKAIDGREMCNLWPHMIMLDALMAEYECAQDARIVSCMQNFFQFCRHIPDDLFLPPRAVVKGRLKWQRIRSGDMLPAIYWLYNHTGESWLLELATRFYRCLPPPDNEWLDYHGVNFVQRFAYPGIYYQQAGDPGLLEKTEYWYNQHMSTWGQQPREIFGADENIASGCVDPRQGYETCSMVEVAKVFYLLGRITGNPTYADRCEDIFLNHFPPSMTPDLKALHYLTASNQPQLDASKHHLYSNKDMVLISYSPYEVYRCCQHNVAMGWPSYVQNLWQATLDGGLVAWMYGASETSACVGLARQQVTVQEETDYPFDGKVTLKMKTGTPAQFPLYLRVPRWCRKFGVWVDGKAVQIEALPGTYVCLDHEWRNGATIEIEMPMECSLTRWPRNGSVTVDRGPLSYSVRIEEEWRQHGGTKEWPEWEVFPRTPWNYGLVLDSRKPADALEVKVKDTSQQHPWTTDAAPLEIKARAKRIPDWKLINETVDTLRDSPIRSKEKEEVITMIPLGCARLRMACLPVIGEGPDAREWE